MGSRRLIEYRARLSRILAASVISIGAGCSNPSIINSNASSGGGGANGGGSAGLGNGGAGGALVVAVTALDAASATRVAGGSCGDGILEGNEQCDDGVPPAEKTGPNAIDTGCNALCQVEANWNCQTPGQPC